MSPYGLRRWRPRRPTGLERRNGLRLPHVPSRPRMLKRPHLAIPWFAPCIGRRSRVMLVIASRPRNPRANVRPLRCAWLSQTPAPSGASVKVPENVRPHSLRDRLFIAALASTPAPIHARSAKPLLGVDCAGSSAGDMVRRNLARPWRPPRHAPPPRARPQILDPNVVVVALGTRRSRNSDRGRSPPGSPSANNPRATSRAATRFSQRKPVWGNASDPPELPRLRLHGASQHFQLLGH